jgi:uncharacterized membrane protein YccF (DUF307 family)
MLDSITQNIFHLLKLDFDAAGVSHLLLLILLVSTANGILLTKVLDGIKMLTLPASVGAMFVAAAYANQYGQMAVFAELTEMQRVLVLTTLGNIAAALVLMLFFKAGHSRRT